jgi:1-acyl-sn-glycerol-3-phosphate acyltransferase
VAAPDFGPQDARLPQGVGPLGRDGPSTLPTDTARQSGIAYIFSPSMEPAQGTEPRSTPASAPAASRGEREGGAGGPASLDLEAIGELPLSRLERAQIRLVRATLRPGRLDRCIRALQGTVGQGWIRAVTSRLMHAHGVERLPAWDASTGFVCIANHRSFFDLFVTTSELVARGLPHRILFPVRSSFFYDHPLGPVVNGIMSFFAMYPPIFRDRRHATRNLAALDEVAELLRRGGFFVGMHPEGTRNRGSNPYALLPAQSGVGRVIRKARVPVLPVFVNGLSNNFVAQVAGGLTGKGRPIHIVFGAPIDLGPLLDAPESPGTYKRIATRCVEEIAKLGAEERAIRQREGDSRERTGSSTA